ncbi:MAG: HPr family phosphocarrier protein [Candidatus Omnitrophica bacterium]|nr:HPr family phosphocarrier protein [Candidatus Omnitrophota bacterium]
MVSEKKNITIKNKQGLHARPAALFVQIASKYDSEITVKKGKETVNGKSIMGILMLAANKGSKITIEATGVDAKEVISELEALLSKEDE